MNTRKSRLALTLALTVGGSVTASASTVLFDNLAEFSAGSTELAADGWIANKFSTGSSCPSGCELEKVTLKLNTTDFIGLFDTSGFEVEITSDGGTVPGASVIGGALMNPSSIFGGGEEVMFTPNVATILQDGDYWVRISSTRPSGSTPELAWEYAFSGAGSWASFDGAFLATGDVGPFLMGVEVTPVPVPAAFWLMGTALAGLAMRAKRKAV